MTRTVNKASFRKSTPMVKLAILFSALWLSVACHPRVPDPLEGLPEPHFVPTRDGWNLALHHYPAYFRLTLPESGSSGRGTTVGPTPAPAMVGVDHTGVVQQQANNRLASGAALSQLPVILCHGLASNRYFFDLGENRSMARYLADRGYDVWMLELRGHGASKWPEQKIADPDGWGIDEYALIDVPAALEYVRHQTLAPAVNWIGHSMGGMVMYVYLSTTHDPTVKNVVTLGSPGTVGLIDRTLRTGLRLNKIAVQLPRVHTRRWARIYSRVSGRLPQPVETIVWHDDNFSAKAARQLMWLGIDDMERGVLKSFNSVYQQGKLVSRDGTVDYQARLSEFHAPLLAIAGNMDGLATSYAVHQAFIQVGSIDRTFELISHSNGYHADYGHADLTVGDYAMEDIYPLIFGWLEERQGDEMSGVVNNAVKVGR